MSKYDYSGITADSMFLLSDNKFRDSKEYYEEHKEQIKHGIIAPLRQLAGAIGQELLSVDPMINTAPVKMVSRVRRDTRFSKDKHLYRDNMWVMFMRDKHEWPSYPCMWFEVFPGKYTAGVGLFMENPAFLERFREAMRENPSGFFNAAQAALSAGAHVMGDCYKKPKPGCPEGLENYYNRKNFYMIFESNRVDKLADESVIDELLAIYKSYAQMYRFLLCVSDKFISEKE